MSELPPNDEFGIERYIDLAIGLTKAPGPEGPAGRTSDGPSVLAEETLSAVANVGQEITVIEHTFDANDIEEVDMVQVEWRGDDPDGDGVGFDQIECQIYWDNTVLTQIVPQYSTVLMIATLMELFTDFIACSAYGTGIPATGVGLSQFTNISVPGWRQNGGTLKLTIISAVGQIIGVNARIIKVNQ